MKFSVIIPLYNKAPYIRKALESVLAQTYTDYELIIVDDGSTDGSAEIAEAILQEATRLQGYEDKGTEDEVMRLLGDKAKGTENGEADNTVPHRLIASSPHCLIRQANSGVSAARNAGVAQAHAEYIAFLDADDWWEPTYLERMMQLIEDYPDAGLYACNYIYYKPGKTHVALHIPTGYINYPKAYYESNAMPVTSITAIIPRNVYDEMGGFPLGIKLGEDFLLWSKIALRYPVAFLNEPLAYYNNDVPATLRATRNLHAPEHHMLFRLELAFGHSDEGMLNQQHQQLESTTFRANQRPCAAREIKIPTIQDWQQLIDKLRVNGLLEYWMSKEYHNQVTEELQKVDWNQQPNNAKRIYKTPICLLKLKRLVMQVGSCVKQIVMKAMRRKVRGER
ncbi:MAG: glycosyltransferase family 2 protein [Paludibacteraceae bacterium]|nr:glycosyltransferase family 2 protein [Paludibacteraceae bacterium]